MKEKKKPFGKTQKRRTRRKKNKGDMTYATEGGAFDRGNSDIPAGAITSRSDGPTKSSMKESDLYRQKSPSPNAITRSPLKKGKMSNNNSPILFEAPITIGQATVRVIVINEKNADKFLICGYDSAVSQRYQLSMTSEEVSNTVDGDVLVTLEINFC